MPVLGRREFARAEHKEGIMRPQLARWRYSLLGVGRLRNPASRRLVQAAALVSLVLASCVASPASATAAPRASSAGSTPPFTVTVADGWGSTWSNNSFSSIAPGWVLQWLTSLPLAVTMPPNLNHYLPALATHWSSRGSTVKVTLRSDARWQDGTRVTSKDLLTTLLIYGTEGPGGEYWPYIGSVATPTATTMVLHLEPGVNASVFLNNLLQTIPVPTSVYGHLLPKDDAALEHEILVENQTANGAETAAAKSAASKLLPIYTRISNYAPASFVGNGPFRIVAHTTSQVKMQKWNGFYDSKAVHVKTVEFLSEASSENVYPLLFNGTSDWSWNGFTSPLLIKKYLSSPGAELFHFQGPSEKSYTFNLSRYPFNIPAVRQALAYTMNVPTLMYADAGGKDLITAPNVRTDGLNAPNNKAFLTRRQFDSLIPYRHRPAKAAQLLETAGFHKVKGTWRLPNHKIFKVAIDTPAGFNINSAVYAAKELKSFGIDASSTEVGQPAYTTYVTKGQFDVAFNFMSFSGEDPLQSLYSDVTNALGGTFGTQNVPGLGRVNVLNTLEKESVTVGPGKEMNHLAWVWARYFNKTVPVINYDNYVFPFEYSTAHYTDWPPAKSDLWRVGGDEHEAFLFEFLIHGYLRPK